MQPIPKLAKQQRIRWLLIIVLLALPSISAAHSSYLALEILPETATLAPGGSISINLIARNISQDETITDLKLDVFLTEDIKVEIGVEPNSNMISPESFAMWQITLTHIEGQELSTKVHFQVSFVRNNSGGSRIKDAVLTSMEVSVIKPPKLTEKASLSIESPITALNENETGWVYLKVTNSSYNPIRLTHITIQTSEDLRIGYPDAHDESNIKTEFDFDIEIPGYHTEVIPFMIRTPDRVDPKDVLVVFSLQLQSQFYGMDYSGSLVETYSIKVGVFGESDILKVLTAVPSMLLLPGFVFLLGWALVSRFTLEEDLYAKLPLKIASVEFWIVSISVSLLAAVVFNSNPLLDRYNFSDIGRVWFVSFLVGILGGLMLWASVSAFKRKEARALSLKTPTVNDTAPELLDKLARQGFSTKLKKVKLKDKNQDVFLLQPENADQSAYIVGPRVMVVWNFEKDEDLYDKAQQLVDENQEIEELIKLIKEGLSDETGPSIREIDFDKGGQIKNPVKKNKTDLVLEGDYDRFIEFDEQ